MPPTGAGTLSTFHNALDAPLQLQVQQRVYQYELLSRMGYRAFHKLSDSLYRRLPLVYSRDFAYDDNAPVVVRMARSNIGDVSAKDYAE